MGFLSLFRKKNKKLLFTTPSHAQKFFIFSKLRQFYKFDISETEAHNPQDALKEAQAKATKIYGTKSTNFLTNGSTSGILAAVLACTNKNDKVLIWDKAHPSHLNAVKLAGCEPVFYSLSLINKWGVYDKIIPQSLNLTGIKALIITSPTYEGIVSDVKSIKKMCIENNVFLIVDEAHGALYPFSDKLPQSAVNIADFTIQSLHKTAGGLNPTALLHVNCLCDVQTSLNMISTTSPSYPLLASIEANINYLNSKKGRNALNNLIQEITDMRNSINNVEFGGDDVTKILIKKDGITGFELSETLFRKYNIEDERTNHISTMLLCGIGTSKNKLKRLKEALKRI